MWVFNVWLYLLFSSWLNGGNEAALQMYKSLVVNGAACQVYMAAWGGDTSPQPACWYDSSNTNSGR